MTDIAIDPADLAMITKLSRAELLALARIEEGWADYVVRHGRWPSERNEHSVALYRARAAACREAVRVARRDVGNDHYE